MRLEIFVLGITAFFVYNAYTDGKYTKLLFSFNTLLTNNDCNMYLLLTNIIKLI